MKKNSKDDISLIKKVDVQNESLVFPYPVEIHTEYSDEEMFWEFVVKEFTEMYKEIESLKSELAKLNPSPKVGYPKFEYGDVVKFDFRWNKDEELQKVTGYVFIVDAYGTFGQPDEPSYDIYSPEQNMLFKHIRESGVSFVRKPNEDDLNALKKL